LDKPTSGLLLFALNVEVLKTLQSQFIERNVEKVYWAIVQGYLSGDGTLDYPLKREVDPYSRVATEVNQSTVTHHHCLVQTELPIPVGRYPTTRYSWVELKPETGRKHQLRRHLAHHTIVGNTRHGDGVLNRFFPGTIGHSPSATACTKTLFQTSSHWGTNHSDRTFGRSIPGRTQENKLEQAISKATLQSNE
jgi:tRNA pseudouridine65 synthase